MAAPQRQLCLREALAMLTLKSDPSTYTRSTFKCMPLGVVRAAVQRVPPYKRAWCAPNTIPTHECIGCTQVGGISTHTGQGT
eukprot:5526114-Alexandrium_andersonii.AAC.1